MTSIRLKKFPYFIFSLVILLSGCSKVQYVDELLTLKKVSDQQDAMAKDVKDTNRLFDKLVSDIQEGRLSLNNSKQSIRQLYGRPVLSEKRTLESEELDVWLYRYATQFFDSDKVYLYFDVSNKLKKWELKEVQNGKVRKETAVETAGPQL